MYAPSSGVQVISVIHQIAALECYLHKPIRQLNASIGLVRRHHVATQLTTNKSRGHASIAYIYFRATANRRPKRTPWRLRRRLRSVRTLNLDLSASGVDHSRILVDSNGETSWLVWLAVRSRAKCTIRLWTESASRVRPDDLFRFGVCRRVACVFV